MLTRVDAQENTASNWYQGKPIHDIQFRGLKQVSASELDGILLPYHGQNFSDDIFWEIQGRLYALEYFDSISPHTAPAGLPPGTEVTLVFTVTERPMVTQIIFEGNASLSRNTLLDAITIKVNDVVNEPRIRLDEQAVIAKDLDKGYPDVRVRSETRTPTRGQGIILAFIINEGEHTVIEAINFSGNSAYSQKTLVGKLSLKAKGLFSAGSFSEAKLIADRDTILSYYRDRGYIDAIIEDLSRTTRRDKKGNNLLTLTFHMYEGRQYTFSGITFSGNQIFPTEELNALIYSEQGQTVNAGRLEADLQRIIDRYLENGYLFNTIEREELHDQNAGTLGFIIHIVERGRAHIEHISVRGNEKTKDRVILLEIPLEPGDIFSKTKIMEGLRNLYNLQFFSAIYPDTPIGSADQLMDVIISVEEQPTTSAQFGVTLSQGTDPGSFPISLLLKYSDSNFAGWGNTAGAEINLAPSTQSASLQYMQRYFLGLPLSASFDLTFSHTRNSAFLDNEAPFFLTDDAPAYPDGFDSYDAFNRTYYYPEDYLMTYNKYELTLGISTGYRWLTPAGNLTLGGGFRVGGYKNAYDAELYRPFDPTLRQHQNDPFIPTTGFWVSTGLDQRDIYYDPNKGYYVQERFGIYGLLPATVEPEHYFKSETKGELFFTLWDIPFGEKWTFHGVLGLHTGVSFILPQFGREKPIITDANQLIIDGMFIGRGWVSKRTDYGNALWENWAEIRIPLAPGLLSWDFFLDMAAVKKTVPEFFNAFTSEDLFFSVGGGLRFAIPQFPFRFIFAKRFKIKPSGGIDWSPTPKGALFGGMDFVLSFALSSY
jgi:outer membrane protein insertion porin family